MREHCGAAMPMLCSHGKPVIKETQQPSLQFHGFVTLEGAPFHWTLSKNSPLCTACCLLVYLYLPGAEPQKHPRPPPQSSVFCHHCFLLSTSRNLQPGNKTREHSSSSGVPDSFANENCCPLLVLLINRTTCLGNFQTRVLKVQHLVCSLTRCQRKSEEKERRTFLPDGCQLPQDASQPQVLVCITPTHCFLGWACFQHSLYF